MAQGAMVSMMAARGVLDGGEMGNGSFISSLTPDEMHELRQYENLLRFHDEVVGGLHPRIKPSHLHGKPTAGSGSNAGSGVPLPSAASTAAAAPITSVASKSKKAKAATKTLANGSRPVVDNFQSHQSNLQLPPVNSYPALPGLGTLSGSSSDRSRSFAPGKVEINPVLLEKSDDLIKAEIQLHRQRVERALKEQVEQRRALQKASVQAAAWEQLTDFDVADVLERALAVVQATDAQPTDDTAANASASSDSFDDNTFYSSQHDTPQSHQISRLPNESDDEQMRDASPYEPEFEPEPAVQSNQTQVTVPALSPPRNLPGLQPQQRAAPGTSTPSSINRQSANPAAAGLSSEATSVSRAFRQLLAQEAVSSQGSGVASRSEESVNTAKNRSADARDLAMVSERLLNQAVGRNDSPVVRAHDLSPIAPQPAHVSPLAVARQQHLALSDSSGRRATPAQVAALRKQPSAATSPESSPQANRSLDRTKNKEKRKKKRKADRLHPEAVASPYIKTEPRSPSPMSAQPYSRPTKRQRQSQPQQLDLGQGESRYDQPIIVDERYRERYEPRSYGGDGAMEYGREDLRRPRHDAEPAVVAYPRYERVYYEDTRPPASARQGPGDSPGVHPAPYVHREVRTARAVSHAVDSTFGEAPTYFREPATAARMSVHPTAYRERSGSPVGYERPPPAMLPPRAAPTRIIVDAYGREYFEPPRPPTVAGDGPVSEHRVANSEFLYGLPPPLPPPPQPVSRRPGVFEDDAMVYQPTSPTYPAPRRLITQPELAGPELRTYRERAYSGQSMAPPAGEYMQARGRPDGRPGVEAPREYISSPASVHPPVEPTRYESAAPVYDRRPAEERPHDYYELRAGSVRPPEGVRYEVPVAYERRVGDEHVRKYISTRSASVRPGEPIRYEVGREYGGGQMGSMRPEIPLRKYAAAGGVPPDSRREVVQPAAAAAASRAYSVLPAEGSSHVMRQDLGGLVQAGEQRYYERQPAQDDDDVVFLDRPPRNMYREMR
ncbi:hypothetical protein B0H66DRAFT_235213 [Apodospora peruviana]|uniref:Uncharacterized protein n=1 Tax=Apodospora peruviana TaxID=516989 RepID=A0AAE0I4C0_9PEZI|nr:hypothetical protein B0H66DRAFT_235213 [Apodospora peruviana]